MFLPRWMQSGRVADVMFMKRIKNLKTTQVSRNDESLDFRRAFANL